MSPVRLTVLIKKQPSVSTVDFLQFWQNELPNIFLAVPITRQNLIKYSQFRIDGPTHAALSSSGVNVADYDGGADFWAESVEALMAIFHDEEYLKTAKPAEDRYFDRAGTVVMLGRDVVLWEDGKAGEGVDSSRWAK